MNETVILVIAGSVVLIYAMQFAMLSNIIKPQGRPSQILYSKLTKMPSCAIINGTRKVHQYRTDFIGANGVIYVGYLTDIPSHVKARLGTP